MIMTSSKPQTWRALTPRHSGSSLARRTAAAALKSASAVLAELAQRLAVPPAPPAPPLPPVLEFYAQSGAPEGALYLDGELVGWVPGVTRL
jgi:hypothetical protein